MTTRHSAETLELLTTRGYALSSYALTYVALMHCPLAFPTAVQRPPLPRAHARSRTLPAARNAACVCVCVCVSNVLVGKDVWTHGSVGVWMPAHADTQRVHHIFERRRPHTARRHTCVHPCANIYIRHRLNAYLASWVPSPPGEHPCQNCTISAFPKTAGKKNTRYPLG